MSTSVAIIVTNYNHGEFLFHAVAQIVNQTRRPDEIIVVDDASTDHSPAVLEVLEKAYPFIRVIRHAKNLGVNAAVCRGVAEASSDFISAVGADDPLLLNFTERALSISAKYPSAAFVCANHLTGWSSVDATLTSRNNFHLSRRSRYFPAEELPEMCTSRCDLVLPTSPSLWRRAAWLKAGGLMDPLRWHSDWFAAMVVSFRHGFCYLPEVLQTIRFDPHSYSRQGQRSNTAYREIFQNLFATLDEARFADVKPLFQKPAVLSRFGFRVLNFFLATPGHREYLTPALINNALRVEGFSQVQPSTLAAFKIEHLPLCVSKILHVCAEQLRPVARQMQRRGQHMDAVRVWRKILAAVPNDHEAARQLGLLEFQP